MMRSHRILLANGLVLLLLCATHLRAQESRISAVTIFSDRAQVTRTLDVALEPGTQELRLQGLPAWLDRGSVRAGFTQRDQATVLDVQIDKVFLAQADDAEVNAAQHSLQEIDDQLADLDDQQQVLTARQKHLDSITVFSMEKIPRDAVTRDIPVQTYKDLVEFSAAENTAIGKGQRDIERKRRDLAPERVARQSRLAELQQKNQLEQVNITVTVNAEAAHQNAFLVKYQLPGATWEPEHEVRIEADNQLHLISYGRVTQTTGEDWEDADITLSTQSPGTPVNIPELESLLLGRRNSGPVLQQTVQEDSFNQANTFYLMNCVAFNGLQQEDAAPVDAQEDFQGNWIRQQQVQQKVQQTFKELQQRGTTALFGAAGKQTIRTDGNAVRMAIGSYPMTGTPEIVAAPEISLNATRTLHLHHQGELPLLPGTVGLYLDGSFIGTTEIPFVGSGESFALFAGLVDSVKISRVLDRDKSSIARGKRENKVKAFFHIEVENLGAEALAIRIADRIPVSEDTAIDVSSVRTHPEVDADSEGLLLWEIEVPPREKRQLTLSYTVKYPAGYAAQPSSKSEPPSRARSQLIDLESKL